MAKRLHVCVVAMFACLTGCMPTNEDAIRTLEANGFSDVTIVDRSVWVEFKGCAKDDIAAFEARATNPKGDKVNVIVCRGWLKGGTIRVK